MTYINKNREIFIPDYEQIDKSVDKVIERTTHMAIVSHQDAIKMMIIGYFVNLISYSKLILFSQFIKLTKENG